MQKTMLYGKPQSDNLHPPPNNKPICQNCLKLQSQLDDINLLLSQKQEQIQHFIDGSENQTIKMVQQQLISLNQKYSSLKKKVKQIQKESDDLFSENTLLEKQINAYKNQLKQQSSLKHRPPSPSSDNINTQDKENQIKQLQVQLFVAQQKLKQLQNISNNQSSQIVKLKQYIKQRNRLQEERHKIISLIS